MCHVFGVVKRTFSQRLVSSRKLFFFFTVKFSCKEDVGISFPLGKMESLNAIRATPVNLDT